MSGDIKRSQRYNYFMHQNILSDLIFLSIYIEKIFIENYLKFYRYISKHNIYFLTNTMETIH